MRGWSTDTSPPEGHWSRATPAGCSFTLQGPHLTTRSLHFFHVRTKITLCVLRKPAQLSSMKHVGVKGQLEELLALPSTGSLSPWLQALPSAHPCAHGGEPKSSRLSPVGKRGPFPGLTQAWGVFCLELISQTGVTHPLPPPNTRDREGRCSDGQTYVWCPLHQEPKLATDG